MTRPGRGFGPAMRALPPGDSLRAAIGAGLGLMVTGVVLWALSGGRPSLATDTALIAPFGASAFLLFTAPANPLSQPWSVVLGNTVSALMALLVLYLGPPMLLAVGLAVLLAMLAMALIRALHPPGGAVAIATLLAGGPGMSLDLSYALLPVATGSATLVLAAMLWHRATGRPYPVPPPT